MNPLASAFLDHIVAARSVELLVFFPDGDLLGMVEISRVEAPRQVSLHSMMDHVF